LARHVENAPEEPPEQLSLVDLGALHSYDRPLPETETYDALLKAAVR